MIRTARLTRTMAFAAALTLAAIAVSVNEAAAEPLPLANPAARGAQDLSGSWRYIIDPQRLGIGDPNDRNAFGRDEPDHNHPLIEYSWDDSPAFTVPSDWNSQIRELTWYDGLVWFRRTLDAAPRPGRRYFLYFEAVNYHAYVYFNGARLGEHEGGFTPFAFEVTNTIKAGRNGVVVGADAQNDANTVPNAITDWKNYGGITRPVWLVEVPETYIHHANVRLAADGSIETNVQLDGPKSGATTVELEIPELGVKARARTDAQGKATLRARSRKLVRWSPKTPRLYDIAVRAEGDQLTDRVGFRTVESRDGRILLNGAPITLYGISIHEEALGENPTRALTWDSARAVLMQAKGLGANFVRLAHYPHAEKMTRLADELGLLVWSEIPVYWNMGFENPDVLSRARRMLAENISRDANRASVVIWSVANETPISEPRNAFLRTLISDTRSLDGSRLVAAAMDRRGEQPSADGKRIVLTIDDPIGVDLDVIGFNLYIGWYGDHTPDDIDRVDWNVAYQKPMILSEFGADALYGNHGERTQRWTEEYQANLYEGYLRMTARIPNFAGTSPWILKDFRSPRRFHGRYQDYFNRKGVIDPSGRHKMAYDVLRRFYEAHP